VVLLVTLVSERVHAVVPSWTAIRAAGLTLFGRACWVPSRPQLPFSATGLPVPAAVTLLGQSARLGDVYVNSVACGLCQ